MKNQYIPNLRTEVPADIRLEVYKEARLLIDKGETLGAFPELTEVIKQRLETATPSDYKKQLRLEYLAKWVQELESKT